jgi:hypothetical protein
MQDTLFTALLAARIMLLALAARIMLRALEALSNIL